MTESLTGKRTHEEQIAQIQQGLDELLAIRARNGREGLIVAAFGRYTKGADGITRASLDYAGNGVAPLISQDPELFQGYVEYPSRKQYMAQAGIQTETIDPNADYSWLKDFDK